MKITMKDIAKEAGVSVTTVSHVINGTKRISEETYTKIMSLVEKYSYVPNTMAQNLRQQNSNMAALVVSSFPDSYITSIVKAVGERARDRGYHLLFINTNENQKDEQEAVTLLTSRMIDGLILSPTTRDANYLQPLIERKFPIVLVNRYDPKLIELPWVTADDFQAGYDGTYHLIGHGHRNIGIIYNFPEVTTTTDRLEGYKEALKQSGIPFREEYLVQGYGSIEGAALATEKLLTAHKEITAIFVLSDRMTIGTISALKNMSKKWPNDIALIGYGDFEASTIIDPPITNVSLPPDTVGKTAFDALLNRIQNPNYNKHIQLPTSLVIRKSCGCN
ncbi:LacI family DNA-binding transcriptional regulator [Ammoniphilus resinae]|uniref:LacI family transcriptional regulator n=1 Tax=Ammoniphilus resinae TaxID=861532 RepID=A0ABS4GSU1_9BACL|nr:LacI family DNA-binding transcriptional regulator [Ammoniphilus resinae]MBP1933349.1 LacI family transcriptional regulator [Ammoniphilus resinae]